MQNVLMIVLLSLITAGTAFCQTKQNLAPLVSGTHAGICINNINGYAQCRTTFKDTLENLGIIYSAEYNGAATVAALLPTVGAVLGSILVEIWMLIKKMLLSILLTVSRTHNKIGKYLIDVLMLLLL
jgi:hypothetical protein